MRTSLSVLSVMLATATPALALAQQTSKYTLVLVASGFNNGSKRDGVSMMNMGVYPGRQECDAAGGGIKVGAVSGTKDGEAAASIS